MGSLKFDKYDEQNSNKKEFFTSGEREGERKRIHLKSR